MSGCTPAGPISRSRAKTVSSYTDITQGTRGHNGRQKLSPRQFKGKIRRGLSTNTDARTMMMA